MDIYILFFHSLSFLLIFLNTNEDMFNMELSRTRIPQQRRLYACVDVAGAVASYSSVRWLIEERCHCICQYLFYIPFHFE